MFRPEEASIASLESRFERMSPAPSSKLMQGGVIRMEQAVKRDRKDFLVFGSPLIGEEEIAEVVATLRSGWIGTGPRVKQFEEMMKQYTGAQYAVAVSSCTAALHLSLLVLGIGPGDEVVTTPMTFAATANAIIHAGAKPVFVDVSRETMLIEPACSPCTAWTCMPTSGLATAVTGITA